MITGRCVKRCLEASLPVLLVLGWGCGDDGPGPSGPVEKAASGVATKAPIVGSTLRVYAVTASGGLGAEIAGPATSGSDGAWTLTVPTDKGSDVLVVATGGSYVDEATGESVALGGGRQLIGCLDMRPANPTATVSPYTHALHERVIRLVAYGSSVASAWQSAATDIESSLGFDPVTTVPSAAAGANQEQKLYAAYLGGVSKLVADAPELKVLTGASPFDLALGLAEDLSDGALDGKDALGAIVQVPTTGGTAPLPALDPTGIAPLLASTSEYKNDNPDLEDLEIPDDVILFPPAQDCSNLALLKTQARISLENTLYDVLNGPDPQSPNEVDLTAPRNQYQAVLDCDPEDLDANLALALLDLAALSMDAEINAAFDEWDEYLDAFVPFETGSSKAGLLVAPAFPTGDAALALPLGFVRRNLLLVLTGATDDVPQLSRTQDIIEDRVLPRLASGIAHMDKVIESPTFEFEITPKMQGDLLEETLRADRTDFLALRAAMHGARAGGYAAIAYEASMPSYNATQLLAGLAQNTGYLGRLRSGYGSKMQSIPAELTAAADDLDAALSSLFAEIDAGDNQDDEILKIGRVEFTRMELEDFQADELIAFKESLQGPVTRVDDWDFDNDTPDVALTLNLKAFFSNPVADWKKKAPPYAVSTETVPYQPDWFHKNSSVQIEVTAPASGSFWASCNASYREYELDDEYCSGPDWLTDALRAEMDRALTDLTAMPGWAGGISLYASVGADFNEGTNHVTISLQEGYDLADRWVEIAVITFAADTYEEWVAGFPDPTMNGLLPGVVDAGQLLETFGFDPSDWVKTFRLDWENGGGGGAVVPPTPDWAPGRSRARP